MTTPNPSQQPLGMSDFFVLEAGEYLERLDAQLQAPEGTAPAPDELVRLARALRGSALMASHQAIARAASGLEALARAVREARRPWDRSEEHTSELQSQSNLVCRLLLEKKKKKRHNLMYKRKSYCTSPNPGL